MLFDNCVPSIISDLYVTTDIRIFYCINNVVFCRSRGMERNTENPSTTLFREYVRIPSVHPDPDYEEVVSFLVKQADSAGLDWRRYELSPGKPILVISWLGLEPSLPSVLLNSHMDVVPVFPEHWTHPPFSAHKDEAGNIYGRGTQDMKCIGIMHLEAVKRLKCQGTRPKRTVHITFVPDEEIDGEFGMLGFAKTQYFKDLNVGFSMDEGMASPDDEIPLYYGERNCFWIQVTCLGSPGHGSRFIENTAAEKAQHVINRLLDYRAKEKARLESNPDLTPGDVTTVNLTLMSGGVQVNVVPDKYVLNFDIRITPTTDIVEFEAMLRAWLSEAGTDVSLEFIVDKYTDQSLTSIKETDLWFSGLKRAFEKHNLMVKPQIFAANTDARYLREQGIATFGFSPMPRTPILLHDHDEFLNEAVLLKGIDIFIDIINNVANC